MGRLLYLASLEPAAGKSVAATWLVDVLSREAGVVGYLRPVVDDPDDDHRLKLVAGRFPTTSPDGHALQRAVHTTEEVEDAIADGRSQEIFASIVDAAHDLADVCDVVLVDGTDYTGVSSAFEFEFNAQVAKNLGAPVVALIAGHGRGVEDLVGAVGVAEESLRNEGCAIAATIVNRVDPAILEEARKAVVAAHEGEAPIFVVPELPLLSAPTVAEVVDALGATTVRAGDAGLGHVVEEIRVLAMTLPNVLARMADGALIVTPGDRHDVILGTLLSHTSPNHPNIAGLVLTGGLVPEGRVKALIDDLPDLGVPIVAVEGDTFQTARAVGEVRAILRPHQERKLDAATKLMDEHADADALLSSITLTRPTVVTPLMLEHRLLERAKADRRHLVLPEGTDPRILEATQILRERGVADLTLLGGVDEVRNKASSLGVDLGDTRVIDPTDTDLLEGFAETYAELRSHKGVTLDQARDVMQDVSYFGTMMVHQGLVDGMISGAAHTTGHTIRPAFEFIKTRPGVDNVSSVFLMALADRVLVYGDCAVIPNPTSQQLADIAIASASTAETFGIEPRVAMLSYSTGTSGTGEDVDRVREATAIVRERAPDLQVEGPIQYDAAIDASVAKAKLPDSAVAGKATVFIFPDLNTGNNTYKAVQRSAGAVAIGPILQGLRKPVNDLSRGCLVPDIVNTVAITAIQAQEAEKRAAAGAGA